MPMPELPAGAAQSRNMLSINDFQQGRFRASPAAEPDRCARALARMRACNNAARSILGRGTDGC